MNWLEFVASLVGALVWPAVVVTVLNLFKNQLSELVPLLRRIKYKDLELEFERELLEAQEKAQRQQLKVVEQPITEGYEDTLNRLVSIADASPRAAILEAWLQVEVAAAEAASKFDLPPRLRDRPSPVFLGRELARVGVLSDELLDVYNELRELRNRAVHAPELSLSPSIVRDYVSLALSLMEHLRRQGPSN